MQPLLRGVVCIRRAVGVIHTEFGIGVKEGTPAIHERK